MKELLSPKQVAASIGVSESSLKRWCDQGVIASERTPGGHRRIRVGEVVRFLREQKHPIVRPEVLGLPPGSGEGPRTIAKATRSLLEALTSGDSHRARRLVFDLYLSGVSVVSLCEQVVGPAMHSIGDEWECGGIEVFQEHRACEIVNRLLYDLRSILPPAEPGAPLAIGGTPPGDPYRLASLMVELVLVDEGWETVSLGSSLPFGTMAAAATTHEPSLFWLSVTHADDADALRRGFDGFLDTTPTSMQVVIGGQGVDPWLSDRADGERVHRCDDLESLLQTVSVMRAHASAEA